MLEASITLVAIVSFECDRVNRLSSSLRWSRYRAASTGLVRLAAAWVRVVQEHRGSPRH